MFNKGSTIQLRVPAGIEAPLEMATVTDGGADRITVRFENRGVAVAAGIDVDIMRTIDGVFTRQPARIETVLADDPLKLPVVGIRTTGVTKPAENRSCFRVSTAAANLTVSIDEEDGCHLLDVSSGGFAATATRHFDEGETVEAEVSYQGRTYRGTATIQSVRIVREGRMRYGLQCLIDRADGRDLARCLGRMAADLQREQLRRRSRTRRAE